MGVIFLDMDGVLNTGFNNLDKKIDFIEEDKMENLRWLVKETDAQIVFTSERRHSYYTDEVFRNYIDKMFSGLTILGITPSRNSDHDREIGAFLFENRNMNIEKYVIIDDINFGFQPRERFVQAHNGLTREVAEKAKEILNG